MAKILVFEDEPAALQRLLKMIKDLRPNYEVVDTADTIEDATTLILQSDFDLILSDIELSDGSCFEIFENANTTKPIIFITAYNDYAVKAFKYNGIHYLLKPLKLEELLQAFIKFEKNKIPANDVKRINALDPELSAYKKRFVSKIGNKYKLIDTADIILFYTETGIVYAKTKANEKFVIDQTLEHILEKLNPKHFFRINRQMILNIWAIEDMIAYSSNRLKIRIAVPHHSDIIVSKDKTADFKEWAFSQ